jgi:hypothetical protein
MRRHAAVLPLLQAIDMRLTPNYRNDRPSISVEIDSQEACGKDLRLEGGLPRLAGDGRQPRHHHQRPHRRAETVRRDGLADRAARAIAAPAATDGPLQLSLFDERDLAEISHPDYPGERLIACRNPLLAAERARTRSDLLAATDTVPAPILASVAAGRLTGADQIGVKVGKVINKFKMAKHLHVSITDTTLAITLKQTQFLSPDGVGVIAICQAAR